MIRVAMIVALLATPVVAGCRGPEPARPPAPEPMPPPPPAGVRGIEDAVTLSVCVVRDGRLHDADARYNPANGDTLVDGRRLREQYPMTEAYASARPWYVNDEPIVFGGRRYVKYGLPRALGSADVVSAGAFGGVAVFVEPAVDREYPEVLYLPVNPFCEFQPYQGPEVGEAVRG